MISNLAKETVAEWEREGLRATFEDCIRLNALGLKVERGGTSDDLGAIPRVAFLGDLVFREPTIARWMWLDGARQLITNDYMSVLMLTAYALNADKLVELGDARKLKNEIERFSERLICYTTTEIDAAVDYALNGAEPGDGEDAEPTAEERETRRRIHESPECVKSCAKAVLMHWLSVNGGSADVAEHCTIAQLQTMITTAAMTKGVDIIKSDKARATADYYRTAGAIHERLLKERNDGKAEH